MQGEPKNVVIEEISKCFTITDLGKLTWILACRITRDRSQHLITIDQEQYTRKILTDAGILPGSNPVSTPMDPKEFLTSDEMSFTEDEFKSARTIPYSTTIGKITYLTTCTRPDIRNAHRILPRFMANPQPQHYRALKRLLRYLSGTIDYKIQYDGTKNSISLQAFTDSDWAQDPSRKSTSGFIITLAGGPVAWASKQQPVVALSTCEAEYIATSYCACTVTWLRTLLTELSFPQFTPTPMFCDNTGTVQCTHNHPQHHSRMKHIDVKNHFIRSCIDMGHISVKHISGSENIADLLTKNLNTNMLRHWVHNLGLDSARGGRVRNLEVSIRYHAKAIPVITLKGKLNHNEAVTMSLRCHIGAYKQYKSEPCTVNNHYLIIIVVRI
jgi:hypothetical protein